MRNMNFIESKSENQKISRDGCGDKQLILQWSEPPLPPSHPPTPTHAHTILTPHSCSCSLRAARPLRSGCCCCQEVQRQDRGGGGASGHQQQQQQQVLTASII